MHPFQTLTRGERVAIMIAAGTASVGMLSAAVALFADDGNTPWFDARSALVAEAQRCTDSAGSSRRHECLREVARGPVWPASAPTRLARAARPHGGAPADVTHRAH